MTPRLRRSIELILARAQAESGLAGTEESWARLATIIEAALKEVYARPKGGPK